MLMEEDTAAVTKLLLVWLVIEVREIIGRLLVSDEVEQPQEFAVNAARGGHTRGQKRQRPMAVVRFPIRADFVSSGLIEELVRPVRVAERAMASHIARITDDERILLVIPLDCMGGTRGAGVQQADLAALTEFWGRESAM